MPRSYMCARADNAAETIKFSCMVRKLYRTRLAMQPSKLIVEEKGKITKILNRATHDDDKNNQIMTQCHDLIKFTVQNIIVSMTLHCYCVTQSHI